MNRRTTLLLLLLVLGLGGLICWLEIRVPGTDRRRELQQKALLINPSAIDRILITPANGDAYACELRQGQWIMASPAGARADAGRVSRLLQKLDRLRKTTAITAEERKQRGLGWAEYGLEDPHYKLQLRTKEGMTELWFGAPSTNRFPVYARQIGNDEVLRVDDDTFNAFPASAHDLRARQIFLRPASEVVRLELNRAAGFVQVVRDANGAWSIAQPVRARASPESLQHLLDLLHTLRVEQFVSDTDTGLGRYGIDDRSPYIRVFHEGADFPVKVTLGSELSDNPRLAYARVEGVAAVIAVSEGMRRLADFELDLLRDRRVLSIPGPALASVRVTAENGAAVTLARGAGAQWSITVPKTWPADPERILALLEPWYAARAVSFLPSPAAGSVPPAAGRRMLALEFASATAATAPQTVEIFDLPGDSASLIAHLLPGDEWALVQPSTIRLTSADPLHYRDRVMLQVAPEDVREVVRRTGGQEAVVRRADPSQPWQVPAGGAEPDGAVIGDLLRAFSPLRAARILESEPRDLSRYGLDDPRIALTLGLAGATGFSRTLLAGGKSPDGLSYAMVRGHDLIFLIDRELAAALERSLHKPRETHVPGPAAAAP